MTNKVVLRKTSKNKNIFNKLKKLKPKETKISFGDFVKDKIEKIINNPKGIFNFKSEIYDTNKNSLRVSELGNKEFFKKQNRGDEFGFNTEMFPRSYMCFLDEKEEVIKHYKNWFLCFLNNKAADIPFSGKYKGFFKFLYDNKYITDNEIIENLKIPSILYSNFIEDMPNLFNIDNLEKKYRPKKDIEQNKGNPIYGNQYIITGIKKGTDLTRLINYLKDNY